MARSLAQIQKELDPAYAGSRKTIQAQKAALPGETQQQLEGLQAQAQQSHTDILDSARRRGLGFSGIPIGEQVQYDSTVFKPAVADLYSRQNERATSLDEALNQLFRDQRTQASTLRQSELDRDLQQRQLQEQIRQFNQQLAWDKEKARLDREAAARSAAVGGYFSGGGGVAASSPSKGGATMTQGKNGFQFKNSAGQGISAAKYAAAKGIPFRQLLSQMAKAGDRNASIALYLVGNDFKADPDKLSRGFDTPTFSYGPNHSGVRSALRALGVLNA